MEAKSALMSPLITADLAVSVDKTGSDGHFELAVMLNL